MERKKLIELIGSIFVALIFFSSYAAFGNFGAGGSNATTTITPSQTYYAVASGNASITAYSSVMNINITCANITSVSNVLNGRLTELQRNGSISNFYSQQAAYILVQAGNTSTYPLYQELSGIIGNSSACTHFTSTASVNLPGTMEFFVPTLGNRVQVSIPQSLRTYSLPIEFSNNMSGTVGVAVSTLLSPNATVYGTIKVSQS